MPQLELSLISNEELSESLGVALKILDLPLPIADQVVQEVVHRQHVDEPASLQDRQVAAVAVLQIDPHPAVRCDGCTGLEVAVAFEIAEHTAGLFDEHLHRGDVPCFDACLDPGLGSAVEQLCG